MARSRTLLLGGNGASNTFLVLITLCGQFCNLLPWKFAYLSVVHLGYVAMLGRGTTIGENYEEFVKREKGTFLIEKIKQYSDLARTAKGAGRYF